MMFAEALTLAIEAVFGEFVRLLPERLLSGIQLEFVVQALAEAEAQTAMRGAVPVSIFVRNAVAAVAMPVAAARRFGKGAGGQPEGQRQGGGL